MNTLLVLAFENEAKANAAIKRVLQYQRRQMITLMDAALVVRRPDNRIKVQQVNSLVGAGAFGGAFWGILVALLFWNVWATQEAGSSVPDSVELTECGLPLAVVTQIAGMVKPGYAACFFLITCMTEEVVLPALMAEQSAVKVKLNHTELARLRENFGALETETI